MVTDKEILTAINELSLDYAPTIQDVALKVGLSSKGNMHRRLKKLEDRKLIKNMRISRISLTEEGKAIVNE